MLVIKEKNGEIDYEATGENLKNFQKRATDLILILDLDGTVRDDTHRLHLLPSEKTLEMFPGNPNAAYNKYQRECGGDTPVQMIITIVKLLRMTSSVRIIVLSTATASRELRTMDITSRQLESWGVDYDLLIMRSETDQRHSIEQKISTLELFEFSESDLKEKVFALDDANHICKAFRDFGITTLQVK